MISLLSLSSTKLDKCKVIFHATLGRKDYQGIFCLDFSLKALFSRIPGIEDMLESFFLLVLVRYDNFQPLVHDFIP